MKNIKTMKAFGSALFIFSCIIVVISMSIYFFSEDKDKANSVASQHVVYQAIGDLGGFTISDNKLNNSIPKIISVVKDNFDNPEVEKTINCYTNTNSIEFHDYLMDLNASMGQLCMVQKNLNKTSNSNQENIDRCTEPESIILSINELEKLDRKYTGDLLSDLDSCKI